MTTYELTTATREDFNNVQAQMISDFTDLATGAEVHNNFLGHGKVISCLNPTGNFESIILVVHFDLFDPDETKSYGASVAITSGTLKFIDESIREAYDSLMEAHTNLKRQVNECSAQAYHEAKVEAKKIKSQKRAEENFEKQKEKAIKDFEELTKKEKPEVNATNEFFYALGWLAKHVGTITAVMPDYLETAFAKYFGVKTGTKLVDSKKRTTGGYSMQWTFSFRASLKKHESVPSILVPYLNDSRNAITKTSFIWDLVAGYGFKFGKEQDIAEIREYVPDQYVDMFVEGLSAF